MNKIKTTKKPVLFGYGKTTKAIAKKIGGGCVVFDDNVKESYTDNNNNTIKPSFQFKPKESYLEITSPGINPKNKLIKTAKNLISEYDYFKEIMPFTIWISGTNGKTTTTQMLTHLLKKRGAVSGGNIGTPIAQMNAEAKIWILETSSFTLHYTKTAAPNVYLLLPITPDHLDWHKDEKEYKKDKLSPLSRMKEGELALIPKGLEIPKTNAYVVEYDSNVFLEEYFKIDSKKIKFKGAFLQDALLSLAITKVLFDEVDYQLMNRFIVDEHRQEEFKDAKDRVWVNDSKATNTDATLKALDIYKDKKIHLILGGDDKGVEILSLFEEIKTMDIDLYVIGKNAEKIMGLSKIHNIVAIKCDKLSKAIEEIDKVHSKEAIAILSPAAASIDQFASYKDRGEKFKKIVSEI